jgi:hypothetical protein
MMLPVTILDQSVDSDERARFTQGAQMEPITVGAGTTGLILNEVVDCTYKF